MADLYDPLGLKTIKLESGKFFYNEIPGITFVQTVTTPSTAVYQADFSSFMKPDHVSRPYRLIVK